MGKLIEINNLSKTFGESKKMKALDGITLAVDEGDFISVTGRSGSGKSTLLKILGFLMYNFDGEYLYKGEDASKFNDAIRAKLRNTEVGYIFQDFSLIEEWTARENIGLASRLQIKNKPSSAEVADRITQLAKKLDILEFLEEKVQVLSGGEKQRIAIARALINNPGMILADEPTGSLDTENAEKVYQILEKLNKLGKTILLVTHEEDFARRAGRQIKLHDGKMEMSILVQS